MRDSGRTALTKCTAAMQWHRIGLSLALRASVQSLGSRCSMLDVLESARQDQGRCPAPPAATTSARRPVVARNAARRGYAAWGSRMAANAEVRRMNDEY